MVNIPPAPVGPLLKNNVVRVFLTMRHFTIVGDALFFSAQEFRGRELWKSDGTAAGTVRVKDINLGPRDSDPRELTAVADTLYFTADDGENGRELWKSDGTEIGTVLVRDIRPGRTTSQPNSLTAAGHRLFCSANDGLSGSELWMSDDTAAGTRMVADINAGSHSSTPKQLTFVAGELVFTASTEETGRELWSIDVTTERSQLVADFVTGPDSGFEFLDGFAKVEIVNHGGTVYLTATDGQTGGELWVIPRQGTLPGDIDQDGDVDFGDFLILSASFSKTVPPGTSGDFDDDGIVGFSDFLVLSANFGKRR